MASCLVAASGNRGSVDNERMESSLSSISSINGTEPVATNELQEYIARSKKAGMYLWRILHSIDCGGQCGDAKCSQTFAVVQHTQTCLTPHCLFSGCVTTKKLLKHYQFCTKRDVKGCIVCSACFSPTSSSGASQNFSSSSSDADQTFDHDEEAAFFHEPSVAFNRIPFQNIGPASRRASLPVFTTAGDIVLSSSRPKTFSDYCEAITPEIISDSDQQPRKVRSKSWTGTSSLDSS
jgi:hypothetical protein